MYKVIDLRHIQIGKHVVEMPCSIMLDPDGNPFVVEMNNLVIINFLGKSDEERRSVDTLNINMARNIWAFDQDGNKVWEVEEIPDFEGQARSFTSVYIENGQVIGGNWVGGDYVIDTKNGTVSLIKGRRPW